MQVIDSTSYINVINNVNKLYELYVSWKICCWFVA